MVDNETPEATSPAETSAVPIGGVVPNPEDNPSADVAEGGEERDEDRVDNVVIAEPEPIVTGPDRQFEDDSGSEEDDEDSGFPGGLPAPATTGIPEDGPTTTTLPNGDVSTIRPGGSVPSSPDNDAPRDRPSDNGGGGSASNGGNAGPAVIAVGVIGSVVALSLILGLLFWFLKRRSKKNFNYVIKTPVLPDSKTGSNEKKWEFDTGSLGPTARSARLPEIVSNGWRALSKIFKPADSISAHSTRRLSGMNVNRRGSEFMADTLPPPAHSRHSSVKLEPHHLEPPGMKNLFGGWWSRDKQFVASSGDALRHSAGVSQFGARGNMPKRRSSEIIVGYGARRPRDQRSSKVSADDFSGALGLMLNKLTGDSVGNPFSDTNATRRNSAGAARLSSTNPFADTYAVGNQYPPPHTPRARGSTTGSISTPAPALAQPWATPSDTRSNVRSDQFDLEIDGHNASISLSSIAYDDGLKRPTSMARIPGRDSYSSRVVSSMSSEIGLDGWGEPGPDVGLGLTSQTQQTERNPDRLPYIGEAI